MNTGNQNFNLDQDALVANLSNPPSKINLLTNKLSMFKNNFNKKYIVYSVIITVVVVLGVLYYQRKKCKCLFTNISFNKNNKKDKNNKNKNKPTLNDDDEDEVEELPPSRLKPRQRPSKVLQAQEPKHIKQLDLTNDEMKIIEDELNNQSGGEDNLSDNNNE